MAGPLFDDGLRALRRDRAARLGGDLFLLERAFDDILDRLSMITRRFGSALLVGCPNPDWPDRLSSFADKVAAIDPGADFARRSGGTWSDEGSAPVPPGGFDLIVAMGTLDSVDDLPGVLSSFNRALAADGLLIGAIVGGESLPALRSAMHAADRASGAASPHVHPRITAPTLATLLSGCGFAMPVIDRDPVSVSYRSLLHLVRDLRAMGCTNLLHQRSRRPLGRAALDAASADFSARAGPDGRTTEQFDILHFAGWSSRPAGNDR